MSALVYLIVAPSLGLLLLAVNWLLAPSRPDAVKASSYECGFDPVEGQTRSPFPVAFYLVGLLFMLFDLEVLLLFPYGVVWLEGGWVALTVVLVFMALLTLGFVYEIGSGALAFSDRGAGFSAGSSAAVNPTQEKKVNQ